ncbi:hypothetical protein TIFTF001_019748 [Ficus carica]|uniref:Uncharacterized protein n=1 Tax=Ficus carica TaxID=3494 RepID=A0AA88AGY1_FICCA|nr:hypothetical protein TIFTF001_019748 [Ficus carica]
MVSQVRMPADHKYGRSHNRPMRNEHGELVEEGRWTLDWGGATELPAAQRWTKVCLSPHPPADLLQRAQGRHSGSAEFARVGDCGLASAIAGRGGESGEVRKKGRVTFEFRRLDF